MAKERIGDTDFVTIRVLGAILGSIERRGMPPTLREIANEVGMASTNGVRYHLRRLEGRGLIERRPMLSRGIRILQPKALQPASFED